VNEIEALRWLRTHNAYARFHSAGDVSVEVNGKRRRRGTLLDAVLALDAALRHVPYFRPAEAS
jgi:hypothetical protein